MPTHRTSRYLIVVAFLAAVFSSSGARAAAIQTSGSQQWPGKIMIGVHPLGAQAWFADDLVARNGARLWAHYKLNFDIAGIIAQPGQVSVWLGGGLNVATLGAPENTFIEPWVFVLISFEKLIRIPLVPFVRFGMGGGAIPTDPVSGMVHGKFGAGMHYWLTKNIGLGFETNFGLGGFLFDRGGNAGLGARFAGFWDFAVGARFAF